MDCPNYPLTELPVGSTISPGASPNVLPTRTLRDYTRLQEILTDTSGTKSVTRSLSWVGSRP